LRKVVRMLLWTLLLAVLGSTNAQVLVPPYTNLALGRRVEASSTCGELNGQPIKEMFCQIAGSNQYTPLNQYSYTAENDLSVFAELRMTKQSFVQGGQNCDFCEANSSYAHPSSNMVDGMATWWQSPPLSRGMQYNQVNITIDLEQEFHVAYVWIQMANSPRPGSWVLERSVDHGKTFTPWQYFAETPAECDRLFGRQTLQPILEDDTVICTHEYSGIHPMENAEIMINLLENRPGKLNFSHSIVLQNFSRATNVRLRLLRTKTLHGHLMDVTRRNDPTVTRRYFYAIKEIFMGGRCVCNGHADTCDILDVRRPRTLLCRCEHNTCGDQCQICCPGFEQKKWQRAKEGKLFVCEPCNCHGHSEHCEYDADLDQNHLSLDIHGNYEGGGRCLNCRDNTEGINCNKCAPGYFRPRGKFWNDTDVCQPCNCDATKHTGTCAEETAICECKPQFVGENCDECASGYYSPPECKPCECSINGTIDDTCLPSDGQCPCKMNYDGAFCQSCAPGFTNLTAGCIECECDQMGSLNTNCSESSGQCACKPNFGGLSCDVCADGYFDYPKCEYCDCDASGTEESICNKTNGICLCKAGFAGRRCDQCDIAFYGYPNCKPCGCNSIGSKVLECDPKSGDCPCYANFTGRQCDRCAAGYYDYPYCKPCSCLLSGSKGMTCDNHGQCYCKPNFQGERCDQCKINFYNFPICEECNCNPSGVVASFAGCDKVAPGELCTCRANVIGRICDQCRPTFWDLQYQHPEGCISCNCNLPGTVSTLNVCDPLNGQCFCKRHVAGRRCERCADGFYELESHSQLGCHPCECDIGGALGVGCDINTGQCRCRPRITGRACDRPIENHYYPTLWHNKYEAEDGITPENRTVRFAADKTQFPNFSWRGFAVFSPIQDEIIIDMVVHKASLYRVLFHYVNPTPVNIGAEVFLTPYYTHTQDVEQSVKATFPQTEMPTTVTVNKKQPFVLNPGRWRIRTKTKQRLFLDYVVLLPSEYYEGSLLKERVTEPCHAHSTENVTCVDLLYPPLPVAARFDVNEDRTVNEISEDGAEAALEKVPIEMLPAVIGPAAFVRADNRSREVRIELDVSETGDYVLLLEYHNLEKVEYPLQVKMEQNGATILSGLASIRHCPYATFCRELTTSNGSPAAVHLEGGSPAIVKLTVGPMHEFGLAAINLIKTSDWSVDYLHQVPVCIRKDGHCIDQWYPPAPNAIVTEAESGANAKKAISAEKLPFIISNAKDVQVMSLDENQATVDIAGMVPTPGHYVFVVHYFNPDNAPIDVDVLLQNEQFHQDDVMSSNDTVVYVPFLYCPSVSGCRTVIHDKERPQITQFRMDDKYIASLYFNTSQKGPIYIDSITTVPYHSFSDSLMSPQPIDLSSDFVSECKPGIFENNPANVSDYCRAKVFSLTSEFNMAALSCDCNSQGSTSFSCMEYGGQCLCRSNVIGRRCDRCAPGHYSFPECIKCRCPDSHLCDERSGQCYCPPHVEGKQCDRCVPYAFGYDPLIGCQLCGCHPNGSEGGQLQCDPNNGQCLCKANVGARKCDKCLPGFYGFSHCYECACETKGTTEEICDETTALCKCKKNVIGDSCDTCRPSTFDLRATNLDGCSECFCFGATDRCRSSYFPVSFIGFDEEAWNVTDMDGEVSYSDGTIRYQSRTENAPKNVYFLAPLVTRQDYTSSYGLQFSFVISSHPNKQTAIMSAAADVQLVGFNTTLDFWATEQPVDPQTPFRVDVKLLPENFLSSSGAPISRPDLMLVLYDLQELRIKASYYENCDWATITEIQLEVARDDQNSVDSSFTASSVELCQCPPPYTGPSCQQCASGYYRVAFWRYLGACVPCECNGHSGSCDADTGICYDCQHETYGDHCELCREGFYGNATTANPYSCLPCACPHPSASNNFALSCQVSETGILESCTCKPGYSSERCERCDVGYFGEPLRLGGSCEECDCNENNDLSLEGSCHPISGDCDLCLNNTDGRHCEYCAQWYYGDAIGAKNCTELFLRPLWQFIL
uniref:Laminin-like protein epi-1 n=1 Tax=Parascaris univalens TaxID=6257 RepID=A0A915BZ56_PARUN